jgi:hypothetical protein
MKPTCVVVAALTVASAFPASAYACTANVELISAELNESAPQLHTNWRVEHDAKFEAVIPIKIDIVYKTRTGATSETLRVTIKHFNNEPASRRWIRFQTSRISRLKEQGVEIISVIPELFPDCEGESRR